MFIELNLQTSKGEKIIVNTDHIVDIRPDKEGICSIIKTIKDEFEVQETYANLKGQLVKTLRWNQ